MFEMPVVTPVATKCLKCLSHNCRVMAFMLKPKRTLKEMTSNLATLRGNSGYSVPVRSPFQLQEEQREEKEIDKVKEIVAELEKKIKELPSLEDIQKEFKHGGKAQLEKRDIKGMPLDMSDLRWHGGGLSTVAHDTTLTGDGTTTNPLHVVGGGGSSFQKPLSGSINGTNKVFTWATAPNAIVVDQTKTIQAISSDTTVNWTGTTTTTLQVAPTFDIYAVA